MTVTDGPLPRNRYWIYGSLALCGLAWDLASKEWVFRSLGYPGVSDWDWRLGNLVRFRLATNFNHGALWGVGQGWAGLFAILSLVAVVAILYVLFALRHARSLWLTVALGFVTAGALGNLFDRLGWHGWRDDKGQILHAVRDFLDFQFFEVFNWAVFNFADSFLVTGAIMLVLQSLKSEQPAAKLDPLPATSAGSPQT